MTENNSHNICAICGREYTGYGNNAYPATIGYCCDECNYTYVIPARLGMIDTDKPTNSNS